MLLKEISKVNLKVRLSLLFFDGLMINILGPLRVHVSPALFAGLDRPERGCRQEGRSLRRHNQHPQGAKGSGWDISER